MEHGSGSPVVVEGWMDDGKVTVEITSKGLWLAKRRRQGPFDEHGRGLALIRGLTNGLDIVADGDAVTLRIRANDQAST